MNKRSKRRRSVYSVLHMQYVHLSLLVLCIVLLAADIFFIAQEVAESRGILIFLFFLFGLIVLICCLVLYIIFIFVPYIELQEKIDSLEESLGFLEKADGRKSMTETLSLLISHQANIEIMKKEAEFKALQSQINPHFLYNTLETIRGQALYLGATDVANTTKALADMFRYNISKKGTMIKLDDELANIDSFIQIEKIRFGDRFEIVKKVDDDVRNIRIPKLIIQPVIENALKHGLEEKLEKGMVLIRAFRTKNEMSIVVKDNGVGMPSERLHMINNALAEKQEIVRSDSSSIGLTNINARLKLIYGNQFGVTITSAQNIGTTVTLHLGILNR